jgi:hypothetical protein
VEGDELAAILQEQRQDMSPIARTLTWSFCSTCSTRCPCEAPSWVGDRDGPVRPGDQVVDLGSGTGTLSRQLAGLVTPGTSTKGAMGWVTGVETNAGLRARRESSRKRLAQPLTSAGEWRTVPMWWLVVRGAAIMKTRKTLVRRLQ